MYREHIHIVACMECGKIMEYRKNCRCKQCSAEHRELASKLSVTVVTKQDAEDVDGEDSWIYAASDEMSWEEGNESYYTITIDDVPLDVLRSIIKARGYIEIDTDFGYRIYHAVPLADMQDLLQQQRSYGDGYIFNFYSLYNLPDVVGVESKDILDAFLEEYKDKVKIPNAFILTYIDKGYDDVYAGDRTWAETYSQWLSNDESTKNWKYVKEWI